MDFLINLLLPQDKTSLDSPLVISFSTFILSNRCVSHGCCKDWKNWSVNSDHFPWFVTSMTCPYVWQYENWKIGQNCGPRGIADGVFATKITDCRRAYLSCPLTSVSSSESASVVIVVDNIDCSGPRLCPVLVEKAGTADWCSARTADARPLLSQTLHGHTVTCSHYNTSWPCCRHSGWWPGGPEFSIITDPSTATAVCSIGDIVAVYRASKHDKDKADESG